MKKLLVFSLSIIILLISLFVCYQANIDYINFIGKLHGVEIEKGKSYEEIISESFSSPIDQSSQVKYLVENDKLDKNLFFYRTDCSDCHEYFSNLTPQEKRDLENRVYFVCTRTDDGSELTKEFNIKEVPTEYQIN